MSTRNLELIGVVVFCLACVALIFGCYAGYWYLAHHLSWLTFAVIGTGGQIFYTGVKEVRKSTRNGGKK